MLQIGGTENRNMEKVMILMLMLKFETEMEKMDEEATNFVLKTMVLLGSRGVNGLMAVLPWS